MVSKKFLACIVTFFCAASAQAGQIPLSASAAAGFQLTEGQSKNLQIDVNNLLAKEGYNSHSIISGLLTVTGFSAPNYQVFDSSTTTTTKSGKVNTHLKHITTNHFDLIADTMTVAAGDASESDSATDVVDYSTAFNDPIWDSTNDNGKGTINKFYHHNNDHFVSVSGGLEVLLELDAAALLDLAKDGILDLSISSFKGRFNVTGVSLDLTAEKDEAPAQSDIPLPTSLLLTGLGLAALGVARRRKA